MNGRNLVHTTERSAPGAAVCVCSAVVGGQPAQWERRQHGTHHNGPALRRGAGRRELGQPLVVPISSSSRGRGREGDAEAYAWLSAVHGCYDNCVPSSAAPAAMPSHWPSGTQPACRHGY